MPAAELLSGKAVHHFKCNF